MAIRFVDVEPGEGERAKAKTPSTPAQRDAAPSEAAPAVAADKLPLAKPEPKPRGRKKPLR